MKFVGEIKKMAKENSNFRQVVATGKNAQVVIMSIPPKGEIGNEVHNVDQILVCVGGEGEAVLDNEASAFLEGTLVFVPAGTWHNFFNTGTEDLKICTVYAPPQHPEGTVHKNREEAEAAEKAE